MTSGSRDSERRERCAECEAGYERYPHTHAPAAPQPVEVETERLVVGVVNHRADAAPAVFDVSATPPVVGDQLEETNTDE